MIHRYRVTLKEKNVRTGDNIFWIVETEIGSIVEAEQEARSPRGLPVTVLWTRKAAGQDGVFVIYRRQERLLTPDNTVAFHEVHFRYIEEDEE